MGRFWLIGIGLLFTLVLPGGTAHAALIWQDTFARSTSNSVGNGWIEVEDDSNDVGIVFNNYLLLRDNGPDGTATQFGISTEGYENISVEFRWRPWKAELNDRLQLSYRSLPLVGWSLVFDTHLGGAETYRVQSVALGSVANDVADLDLSFRIDASYKKDAVKIDYVRVHGTQIENVTIPIAEPASAALFLVGLAALVAGQGQHARRVAGNHRPRGI